MTRQQASELLRKEMNKHGLTDWHIRLNQDANSHFLGLCSHRDKTIILSAHHIDIHPDPDVINTIRHEIAHALTPGERHNEVWAAKAREVGCDNTMPCSNLSLSPEVIDAIRSGATVEVTFDEQVIRTPKYNITRLQDKCDKCGKVAKSLSEKTIVNPREDMPDMKFITLECGHMMMKKIPKGTAFGSFQMGGDPKCQHVWDKNNCTLCARKRPYDFQVEGMKFGEAALAVNNGVGIFDEMGLGKTIQAEGIIKFHPELWPTLWIVKSGLKYQFSSSILYWMGDEHVPQIVNTSKDWLIPGLKHYIIGYDMLVPKTRTIKATGKVVNSGFDITQFERVGIKCVVLDECQQIKNVDSSRTQMVRRVVKGKKVIALSGTPWNNRGSELFPVLNMLDYVKFNSEEGFKRTWVNTFWHGNQLKEGGIRNIEKFKAHTKDILIRRERTEVMKELPLVNRTKLFVTMDDSQEKIYDEAVDEFVKWFEEQVGEISGMMIIAAMQKMRHLVALAKIPATVEYVDEFIEDTDKKLVVFAHHKDVQSLLYDELNERYSKDMPVFKLTAEMSGIERFETQEKFNAAPRALLVASQLAAGEGLNLQTCADCVMHERQWNPGKEEQCEGRFIRIGQTATSVSAVYAHLNGLTAIDSSLDAIVERKRIQFHAVMNNGEAPRWSEDSIMKELAQSIVNSHRAKRNRKVS
jgi:superfamily II DNA or RNA helicase